jgi:glycosyltransferase involved in cell wall biosynthesis
MKLSIITISYNAENEIEDTIKSVINQTYKNIEYIIVDGNSTDGTKAIIGKYRSYITKYLSEKDKGISDAFNKGLKLATGDYIVLLNAGDVFVDNDVVSKVVSVIEEDGTVDMIHGNAVCRLDLKPVFRMKALETEMFNLIHPFINHQALFAKRDLFNSVGEFNVNLKFGMDYDWMLRGYFKGAVIKPLDIDVVYYSLGGTSDQNIVQALNECRTIALSYGFEKKEVNPFYGKKIRRARLQNFLNSVGLGLMSLKVKAFLKSKYDKL